MEKITCECSICLEPFETPRGLPCLHNFCTKCLQWHIDNNKKGENFACPMCRTPTSPPDTSKPSSIWATTFPIANIVCELMELLHIKNEQIKSSADHCEICVHRNLHADSIALCKTCELNLCQDCSEIHSIGFPGHKIMLDKDSLPYVIPRQESDPICPTHKNMTLDLFCIKCDTFICLKCTFGKHAFCNKEYGRVKAIDVLAEEKRDTDKIQMANLENGRDEMNKLIKDTEIAKENLLVSKVKNEAQINKIVDDMIALLERKRAKGKVRLEQAFDTRRNCLEKTFFVAQKRLKGLNQRISKLQTNLKIENKFEYLCESKETVTETVDILLPTDFSVKSDLSFSVEPEFRLIFDKMERIDIGNAFIALDTDYKKTPWCKFETPQKLTVQVYSADIITTKVDGIVNPTDSRLTHRGELSQHIILAAGPAISDENEKVFMSYGGVDQLDLSDVYPTRAGNLTFQFIIHAVVPDYEQIIQSKTEQKDFENLIAQTVSNSLFLANSLQLQSVALPSFCFSSDFANSCSKGYLQGVLEFSENYCANSTNTLNEVHFVDSNLHATDHIQVMFKKYLKIIYNMAT